MNIFKRLFGKKEVVIPVEEPAPSGLLYVTEPDYFIPKRQPLKAKMKKEDVYVPVRTYDSYVPLENIIPSITMCDAFFSNNINDNPSINYTNDDPTPIANDVEFGGGSFGGGGGGGTWGDETPISDNSSSTSSDF